MHENDYNNTFSLNENGLERVFRANCSEYVQLANRAAERMHALTRPYSPQWRPSDDVTSAYRSLSLSAYFMKMYYSGYSSHPLYRAAMQGGFKDFKVGVQRFFAPTLSHRVRGERS